MPDHSLKTIAHLHIVMVGSDIHIYEVYIEQMKTDRQTDRQTTVEFSLCISCDNDIRQQHSFSNELESDEESVGSTRT